MKKLAFLSLLLTILGEIGQPWVNAQSIIPQNNTTVDQNNQTYNITGGNFSSDNQNLFHDFSQFNLNQGEIANFISNPNINNIISRILNNNPSLINGLIQVTGGNSNLYLINPAGIIFGQNAQLNVPADFVATTATGIGFSNGEWLNSWGNNDHTNLTGNPTQFAFDLSQAGTIINAGNLQLNPQHNITFLAGQVLNTGTINSPEGNIIISSISGQNTVKLSQNGTILNLQIDLPRNLTEIPSIIPLDLPALLTGKENLNTGITLNQNQSITVNNSSLNSPDNQGLTLISGEINTSGNTGGSIYILGDQIAVIDSQINSNGNNGGGEIYIGGGQQGQGTIANAQQIFINDNSVVNADAINTGDGGKIITFSEDSSQIYGHLSAKGGNISGQGGFIETSGLKSFEISKTPDISAPNGQGGSWLIDPFDITIVAGSGNVSIGNTSVFTSLGTSSQLGVDLITTGLLSGNVIITTGSAGGELGNITLNTDLNYNGIGTGKTLTLNAHNDIIINGNITQGGGTGNSLSLIFNADSDSSGSGVITVNSNLLIESNGGNITMGGNGNFASGISLGSNSILDSGGGDIGLTGNSANLEGIKLDIGSQINSQGGLISLSGTGQIAGVDMSGYIQSGNGNILVFGNIINGGSGVGILVNPLGTFNAGTGTIQLSGNSPNGDGINMSNGGNMTTGSLIINGESSNGNGVNILSPFFSLNNSFLQITSGSSSVNINGDLNNFLGAILIQGTAVNTGLVQAGQLTIIGNTGDINTGNISTTGDILLQTQGGNISTFGVSSNAGNIVFEILGGTGSITTNGGNISTVGCITPATISLTSSGGSIDTGDLSTSSPFGDGGNITLNASTSIRTGLINTSSLVGNAGNVFLDPTGNVTVDAINAEGGNSGFGGNITIIAGQYFQALGTFISPDRQVFSISTRGSLGNGSLSITHGGNGITPFIIGDASMNGTAGDITTGNVTLTAGESFLYTYEDQNLGIFSVTEPPITPPNEFVDQSSDDSLIDPLDLTYNDEEIEDSSDTNEDYNSDFMSDGNSMSTEEDSVATSDESITGEFTEFLGVDQPQVKPEAKSVLRNIEELTGIKPAIVYLLFEPPSTEENQAIWQFNMNRNKFGKSVNSQGNDNDFLTIIMITARGDIVKKQLSITRKEVLEKVSEFRTGVTNVRRLNAYLKPSQQLYQWFITPIEKELKLREINNISFIMDSGLRSLPIAALNDGNQFIIEKYSVGIMPSLALTNTEYVDLRKSQVLAMGASQFTDASQNPLPAVPLELNEISQNIWKGGSSLLNDQFTLSNINDLRQKQDYGIVHLATHGEFQSGGLHDSYIQLWDQKLYLDQLNQLKLNNPPVHLLVLSACRTALGDPNSELGFAGLAVLAGVQSALGSLWYVSDQGTLGLMSVFYEKLQETPIKAEALRQAQLALLHGDVTFAEGVLMSKRGSISLPPNVQRLESKDLSHPYYWSSFTLVGNPW